MEQTWGTVSLKFCRLTQSFPTFHLSCHDLTQSPSLKTSKHLHLAVLHPAAANNLWGLLAQCMGSKSTSAWKRLFVGTSLLRRWLRVKLLNLLGPGGALLVPPAMRRLQELHLLTTPQRRNLQQRGRRGQTPSAWFLRNVYLYLVGMRIYCWALLGSKQFMCADFCTWLKLFGSLLTYLGQFYFFFNYHVTQSKKKSLLSCLYQKCLQPSELSQ